MRHTEDDNGEDEDGKGDGKLSRDEDCFIIKVSQSSDVFSQLFPTQFIKLRNMLRKTF